MTNRIPRFMLLQILDQEVYGLLSDLRRIFGGKGMSTDIHMTVRGPYYRPIKQEIMEKSQREIEMSLPFIIHGIGIFKNPQERVVYIKAQGATITKILWKPDFPKKEYNSNPHISLYRGSDNGRAKAIYDFLSNRTDLEFACHKVNLIEYCSKQSEMYEKNESAASELPNSAPAYSDIIVKAKQMMTEYEEQAYISR